MPQTCVVSYQDLWFAIVTAPVRVSSCMNWPRMLTCYPLLRDASWPCCAAGLEWTQAPSGARSGARVCARSRTRACVCAASAFCLVSLLAPLFVPSAIRLQHRRPQPLLQLTCQLTAHSDWRRFAPVCSANPDTSSYNPVTGVATFRVHHWTRYGTDPDCYCAQCGVARGDCPCVAEPEEEQATAAADVEAFSGGSLAAMREQDVALGILRLLECRQEAQQQAEFEDPRGGTTLAIVQELLHSHDIDGRVLLTALDMDCGDGGLGSLFRSVGFEIFSDELRQDMEASLQLQLSNSCRILAQPHELRETLRLRRAACPLRPALRGRHSRAEVLLVGTVNHSVRHPLC